MGGIRLVGAREQEEGPPVWSAMCNASFLGPRGNGGVLTSSDLATPSMEPR